MCIPCQPGRRKYYRIPRKKTVSVLKIKRDIPLLFMDDQIFLLRTMGCGYSVSRSTSDGDSLNWCKCKYRCHGNVFGLRIDSMEMHKDVYFAHYKNRKGAFVKFHIWFYKRGISSLGKTLLECKPPVASQFLLIVVAYLACR